MQDVDKNMDTYFKQLKRRYQRYAELAEAHCGTLPFDEAVKVATKNMAYISRIDEIDSHDAITALGLIRVEEFLPPQERFTPAGMAKLLAASSEDYYLFMGVRAYAGMPDVCEIFPELKNWANDFVKGVVKQPPPPRGRPRFADIQRNAIIVREIMEITKYNVHPTRNSATDTKGSACDVIVEALINNNSGVDYKTVEKIWNNRQKIQNSPILEGFLSGNF